MFKDIFLVILFMYCVFVVIFAASCFIFFSRSRIGCYFFYHASTQERRYADYVVIAIVVMYTAGETMTTFD